MAGTTADAGLRGDASSQERTLVRESLAQTAFFLKNFVRHPHLIGAAFPSSRYLINRVLSRVQWEQTHNVIEYGPGIGTFTRPILNHMLPDARLLALEINEDFCRALRSDIRDPRFELICGSAADVTHWMHRCSIHKADFILSGIPYTFFSHEQRRSILMASRNALSPRGVFVSFQYTRAVLPDLQDVFRNVVEDFELINLLPARLFYCTK